MKRSEINAIMTDVIKFLDEHQFYLPPFAYWSLEDWNEKGPEISAIINNQLGWDITDFGSGNFDKIGLFLFTIRNGSLAEISKGGKPYCEKLLVSKENQVTPMHFHFSKMEDIINRGGGILQIQLHSSTAEAQLDDTPVTLSLDGVKSTFDAGAIVELRAGESITLPPYIYHTFWGKEGAGMVLIGEISTANDDRVDNQFLEEVKRFGDIDEDEPPLHLLYTDYAMFLRIP